MKKILILTALSQELNIVKKEVKKLNFKNLSFSFFSTGVGNYNMILNLTKNLEKNDYDFILNIGVCGYIKNKLDFFQVARIKNLANNKELIVPNIIDFGKLDSILCSENIVYDSKILGEENYVDMESYGFEKVVDSYLLPRIILKVPVDKVGNETKNFDFDKAGKLLEKNIDYNELFLEIEKYLDSINTSTTDLSKYIDFFNFSFTQKLIFENLYNKYEILTGDSFENYFYNYTRNLKEIKNQKYETKKFLENLDKYLENK